MSVARYTFFRTTMEMDMVERGRGAHSEGLSMPGIQDMFGICDRTLHPLLTRLSSVKGDKGYGEKAGRSGRVVARSVRTYRLDIGSQMRL